VKSRFLFGGVEPRRTERELPVNSVDANAPRELLLGVIASSRGDLPGSSWVTKRTPGLAAALDRQRSRAANWCGPYDGEASGPTEISVIAPTTIETVAICPFRFFATHVLATEVVDEPERRITISPEDRGSAMHASLEEYGRRRIAGTLPLSGEDRARELSSIAQEIFDEYERFGRTGSAVLWEIERRRILANLERERQRDESRLSISGSETIAVEHRFGPEVGDAPVVEVRGHAIAFR
jgi:hypothetical protein